MTGITLAVPLETRLTATDPHGANRIRRQRLLRAIAQCRPPAPERRPASISRPCWDLLRAMLDREATQRISAATALSHPWVSDMQHHQSKSVSPDQQCSSKTLAPSGAQTCPAPGPFARDIAVPGFSARAPAPPHHEPFAVVPSPPQLPRMQCEGLRALSATPPAPPRVPTSPFLHRAVPARRAGSQPAALVPSAQTTPRGHGNASARQTSCKKHNTRTSEVSTAVPSERGSPPGTPPSPEPLRSQTVLPRRATLGRAGRRSASARSSPVQQVSRQHSPWLSRRTVFPSPAPHRAQSGLASPWPGQGRGTLYSFGAV